MALHLLLVSLFGALGCALRILARDALVRAGNQPWWSVCAINLYGAFAMGLIAGGARALDQAAGTWFAVAMTGMLAGWTTYSTFSMDVVQLWLRGERRRAAALWAITMAGAPLLAWAGSAVAAMLREGAA